MCLEDQKTLRLVHRWWLYVHGSFSELQAKDPMDDESSIPGFTVESFIDPSTGKGHSRFFWKHKRAFHVELKGVPMERLGGFSLISKDLEKVSAWASMANEQMPSDVKLENTENKRYFILSERKKYDLVKGLFVAALIFYGKAFTSAKGRRVKLDKKSLDNEYQIIHEYFMTYRHNFAAHSGDAKLETTRTNLVLTGSRKKGFHPLIHTGRIQPDNAMVPMGDFGLVELADHAKAVADLKYNNLSDHIMNKYVLPRGPEFWEKYARSKKHYVIEDK